VSAKANKRAIRCICGRASNSIREHYEDRILHRRNSFPTEGVGSAYHLMPSVDQNYTFARARRFVHVSASGPPLSKQPGSPPCLWLQAMGGANFEGMEREFQDDLVAVNSARLRAEGVIKPDAVSALVSFGHGENALLREIKLWHRKWAHGRGLSLFLCPACGG
jgi:hypothetical protein